MVRRVAAQPRRVPCTSPSRPRDAIRPWSGAALWGGGWPGASGSSWRRAARGAGPGAGDRGPRRGQTAPRLVRPAIPAPAPPSPERGRDSWRHGDPSSRGALVHLARRRAANCRDAPDRWKVGGGNGYPGSAAADSGSPSASRRSAPARTRSRCGCLAAGCDREADRGVSSRSGRWPLSRAARVAPCSVSVRARRGASAGSGSTGSRLCNE